MNGLFRYLIYAWVLGVGVWVGDLRMNIDGREGASERAKVDMRLITEFT
jgi:hypothetical protein